MTGTPVAVLSRLRTDLPDSAVLSTAPPVPRFTGDFAEFSLRIADPGEDAGQDADADVDSSADAAPDTAPSADAALVADWMNRPHLVETWEQPWSAQRWAADWRAKLSTTYAVPLIISLRGQDIGYLEIYRPLRDEIGAVYASEPHDLGLHIAVGEENLTGRGIVGPLLGELPRALSAADPECGVVVAEPDFRNDRMHAVLRREGWADRGECQQRPDRRVRLFLWGKDATTRD